MSILKGKVIFVGDQSVGKTSIIRYFQNNSFVSNQAATIAADSITCKVDYKGISVPLNVWDTAGQDDYRCLVPLYARSAQVAVIVFDLTNYKTFENVEEWLKYLDSNNGQIPSIFLVGNKMDLENSIPDTIKEKSENFASANNMKFYQTSAKVGQGIDILFYAIAEAVESITQIQKIEPIVFPTQPEKPKPNQCNC